MRTDREKKKRKGSATVLKWMDHDAAHGPAFLVFSISMVLILYFGVLTNSPPNLQAPLELGDKVLHFLAFATLSFSAFVVWPHPLRVAVWVSIFGLTIEFIQSLIPYRDASAIDFLANTVGILAGFFLWKATVYIRSKSLLR